MSAGISYGQLWGIAWRRKAVLWLASDKIEYLRLVPARGKIRTQLIAEAVETGLRLGHEPVYELRVILAERILPPSSHLILPPADPNHRFLCRPVGTRERVAVEKLVWT